MSRKIGLIVEGASDKPVVEALLANQDVNPIIRIAGGAKILSAPSWMVPRLYADGAAKVIALKDSHCRTDVEKYRQQVEDQLGQIKGLEVCLVIHAIESWLLADSEAIGGYLGMSVKPVANPEKVCKLEEALNHIFRLGGRSYVKRADAPGIANRLNYEVVSKRSPSFVAFLQAAKGKPAQNE